MDGGNLAPDNPQAPKKKPERGKDIAGHEFAGEVSLSERIGPPRPAPAAPQGRAAPPRPPRAPGTPPPPRPAAPAPDPSIAGSKYFTSGPSAPQEPRQMSSIQRERSKDSDALDSTIDDDLGEVARRRDRERAAQAPSADEAPAQQGGSGGARKDSDGDAHPRELDFSAPNMPRKRRL